MSKLVVNGAKLKCSQGVAPSTLTVLPVGPASGGEQPAATVMDMKPMVNVAPFGMCQAPANPQVAAATAAAMGVLTPMPCLPVILGPWSPGAVRILGMGAMGVVFEAVHVHLDQHVAIKVLKEQRTTNPEVHERFLREAKAAGSLKSQHFAHVSDYRWATR